MPPSSRRPAALPLVPRLLVPRRPAACLLAACLLASCLFAAGCGKKKDEPTYADHVVGAMREGQAMDARGDMQSMAIAITNWVSSGGDPAAVADFEALATALERGYLRRVPRTDPWGAAYLWKTEGSSWELRSAGRDGQPGNADDMVMQDGQVTQMPASFSPVKP